VIPNRNKTLVGLPRLSPEPDQHEPFELRARMVQLPAPEAPRAITQVRLRAQPAPSPASGLEPLNPAHCVTAILVMAITGWIVGLL
jgi:hypothetical protein